MFTARTTLVLLRLEKGTYICCSLVNQKELEMNALFAMFSEVLQKCRQFRRFSKLVERTMDGVRNSSRLTKEILV